MKRLTDKRFLSEGFYQPKNKEEFKEIQMMDKPTYEEIYKRLGEYENLGLSPEEIRNLFGKIKKIFDKIKEIGIVKNRIND